MQIRTRITLWYTLLTALLLVGSLFFIYYLFSTFNEKEFFSNLRSRAIMTVLMFEKSNPDFFTDPNFQENENLLPEKENIILYTPAGQKLFSLHSNQEIPLSLLQKTKQDQDFQFDLKGFRYVATRYTTMKGRDLIIVASGTPNSEELSRLSRILLLTFFIFIILVSAIGYYFSGKVLSPINKTINEINSIKPSDLSNRLLLSDNRDEMQRLAETFNRLLDRIEEAFRIQKGFLSNFSHEVRNPIGSMIAAIQVSLSRERSEAEYKHALQLALQDAMELENTAFQLMELARLSDKTNTVLLQPLRIDEVVWQAKAAVRKIHPEYHFKFDDNNFPENEEKLTIIGNESLLKAAFFNLFENACKFSPDCTAALSLFDNAENEICLQITDSAKTLTEEEKESIFKPFYRSPHAKNLQGTGIGLSLVHSILTLHKARLTIAPNLQKGNIFQVFFQNSSLSKKQE